MDLNRIELIGHVGKDPEIRYLSTGEPVASFSLATSERWTDKGGQKQERTQWHRITVFGALAKTVRDYVAKGRLLYVAGQMVYEEYTDKEGNKRTSSKVKLSGYNAQLILLGGGNGEKAAAQADGDNGWKEEQGGDDSDVPF